MHKTVFWVSVAFWVAMMSLLVRYDVLPDYLSSDNPGYDTLLRGVQAPIVRQMVVLDKGGKEVGTSQTTVNPATDGTYSITNVTRIDIQVGILMSRVLATLEVYVGKDRELDRLFLSVNAGGVRADVTGTRKADKIMLKTSLNGQIFENELPYENGLVSSYFEPFEVGQRLKVGQVWHTRVLDPLSQKFTTAETRVVGKETLTMSMAEGEPATKIDTYKIVMDWGTTQLAAWSTDKGVILKEETPLGYTLQYREAKPDDTSSERVEVLRPEVRGQESQPGS